MKQKIVDNLSTDYEFNECNRNSGLVMKPHATESRHPASFSNVIISIIYLHQRNNVRTTKNNSNTSTCLGQSSYLKLLLELS